MNFYLKLNKVHRIKQRSSQKLIKKRREDSQYKHFRKRITNSLTIR